MNKSELISEIADKASLSQKQAGDAVDALIDTVQSAVAGGDKISLPGFGTWERRERAARTGKNPQTGEPLQIAASKVPAFKAGSKFKSIVNK